MLPLETISDKQDWAGSPRVNAEMMIALISIPARFGNSDDMK
jgi:hypothetical protein